MTTGMQGEPVMAEASMTSQQHEAHHVFPPGKLSLDLGTLAVACCTGSWGWGVRSDLCLHTGLLVAAVATLAFHACLWGP